MKLLDSNIVIYFLDKSSPYYERARKILLDAEDEFGISALSYFEIFLGIPEEKQVFARHLLIESFRILEVNRTIAEKAAVLMKHFKKSKHFKIDAMIAATALFYDISLITHNTKDFSWIPDLKLVTFS